MKVTYLFYSLFQPTPPEIFEQNKTLGKNGYEAVFFFTAQRAVITARIN